MSEKNNEQKDAIFDNKNRENITEEVNKIDNNSSSKVGVEMSPSSKISLLTGGGITSLLASLACFVLSIVVNPYIAIAGGVLFFTFIGCMFGRFGIDKNNSNELGNNYNDKNQENSIIKSDDRKLEKSENQNIVKDDIKKDEDVKKINSKNANFNLTDMMQKKSVNQI